MHVLSNLTVKCLLVVTQLVLVTRSGFNENIMNPAYS